MVFHQLRKVLKSYNVYVKCYKAKCVEAVRLLKASLRLRLMGFIKAFLGGNLLSLRASEFVLNRRLMGQVCSRELTGFKAKLSLKLCLLIKASFARLVLVLKCFLLKLGGGGKRVQFVLDVMNLILKLKVAVFRNS